MKLQACVKVHEDGRVTLGFGTTDGYILLDSIGSAPGVASVDGLGHVMDHDIIDVDLTNPRDAAEKAEAAK